MDAIGQHSLANKLRKVPGLDADRTNCTTYMDANGQNSLTDKLCTVPGLDAYRYQLHCLHGWQRSALSCR
jgi:hypothetical protein